MVRTSSQKMQCLSEQSQCYSTCGDFLPAVPASKRNLSKRKKLCQSSEDSRHKIRTQLQLHYDNRYSHKETWRKIVKSAKVYDEGNFLLVLEIIFFTWNFNSLDLPMMMFTGSAFFWHPIAVNSRDHIWPLPEHRECWGSEIDGKTLRGPIGNGCLSLRGNLQINQSFL